MRSAHETDFHQFMLYTPVPGTPLYSEMEAQGRMLPAWSWPTFTARTSSISVMRQSRARSRKRFLDWAFRRDFERNGPSLYRICRTTLDGWKRYRNDADPRVRARFEWEARSLRGAYSALLWAMEKRLRWINPSVSGRVRALREEMAAEFGFVSKVWTKVLGPFLLWTSRQEEKRLARGVTYEPKTIIERCRWVACNDALKRPAH